MKALLVAAAALLVPLAGATERPPLPSCPSGGFTPFVSKGCYSDDGSSSALAFRSPSSQYSMTVEQCTAECKGNGYRYAGLKYYGVCYCGSSLDAPKVDDSQCSLACSGDKKELCGGNTQLSVWEDPTFSKCGSDITSNDYESLGCYDDDGTSEGRALNHKLDLDANTFTTKICLDACRVRGYPYAGTEYGNECWCGTNVGSKNVKVDDAKCDMACTGNPSSNCGGRSLVNLYHAEKLESTEPCSVSPSVVPTSSSLVASTVPAPSSTATRMRTRTKRCSARRPSTISSSASQTSPADASTTPSLGSTTPIPSTTSSQASNTPPPSTASSESTAQQSSTTPQASTTPIASTTPPDSATTHASSTPSSTGDLETPSSTVLTPGSSVPGTSTLASSTPGASTTESCTGAICNSSSVSSTPVISSPGTVSSMASTTEPCTDNLSTSTPVASTTSQVISTPGSSLSIPGTSSPATSIATLSTPAVTSSGVSSTEPCTDDLSTTTKASSSPDSSAPASSTPIITTSTSKVSSTEPCTDDLSSSTKVSSTATSALSTSSTPQATIGATTSVVGTTTTVPTTTQKPATTSTQAMCTATHTQPATCEFKCGNWCAPALPDWKDQNSCLNAAKTCSLQIASCFKTAGWPKAIDCFDFSKWCGQVKEYCHSDCPSGNCGKTDCWNKRKPTGSIGNPPTISTTVYPCPVTSTLTTSVAKPSTTSHCAPAPTNICKQPSNTDWGYGPGKPVAGVPLPVVGCNDVKEDWKSNPFKFYNHPDSRSCQSFPWNQRPDVCADACQEQYDDCVDTYVKSCNDQSWRNGNHKRHDDDGECATSNTRTEWRKSGCDKVHCWGQGGNDGNTAQKRCKAQYQDCLAVNKNIQPSNECKTWCDEG